MTAAPVPAAPTAQQGLDIAGPAGLGARIGANLLDALISAWPLLLAIVSLYVVGGVAAVLVLYLLWLVNSLVVGLVNWGMTARRGCTLGQRALGLRVLDDATLTPIGWGRAFVRHLVLGLLGFTGIGLVLNAAVISGDPRRRGWHDRSVGARVVALGRTRAHPTPVVAAHADGATGLPSAPAGPSLATPRPSTAGDAPPSTVPVASTGGVPGLVPTVLAPSTPGSPRPAAPPLITHAPGTPAPVAPAVTSTPAASTPAAPPPDVPADLTTLGRPAVPVSAPRPWVLRLADGQALPDDPRVVVGRAPVDPGGTPYALADPARSLSKTHAAFVRRAGVVTVEDLGSTNGVALLRGDSQVLVEPATPTPLRPGDRVLLGKCEIRVEEGQ